MRHDPFGGPQCVGEVPNAATGSSKNIAPWRLATMSTSAGANDTMDAGPITARG